ncbi:MAG: AraC family transcriptional regulator, partial [Verrucomicrobia bacterium]|nr:AraC family transcriptional regulator [Verrucomicrobiota bacterium]
IAYDVGFQSLTHFNRMFRKIVGESPTAYRESKSVRQLLN